MRSLTAASTFCFESELGWQCLARLQAASLLAAGCVAESSMLQAVQLLIGQGEGIDICERTRNSQLVHS